MAVYRTFLFTPGNHPRKVEKSCSLATDAIIIDLEDAVAVAEKVATRGPVRAALDQPRRGKAYVRVNPFDSDFCYADIKAVVCARLDGIVLPKVETPDQLVAVDWLLSALESELGLSPNCIDVIPIVETAVGIANLHLLPGPAGVTGRVKRLAFGAGDYTLDTGMTWSHDEGELYEVRSQLVRASRAANLEAPLDTVWVDIKDDEGFLASCRRVKAMGFQGKMCIYPPQVEQANRVFTPSSEEIAEARNVVAAFDDAEASGSASIQIDGRFVDYPIVEKARRIIAIADAIEARGDVAT